MMAMLCVPVQVEVGQPPVAGVELSDQTFLEIDPSHQTSQSQAQMHPGLVVGKKYWACWSHQMYLRKNNTKGHDYAAKILYLSVKNILVIDPILLKNCKPISY